MRWSSLLYLPLAAVWSLAVCPSGSPPSPQTVRAREGDSTILDCDLQHERGDRTTSVIEWIQRDLVLPIFIKFGIHPPRIDAAYIGRLSLQEGDSLLVDDVRSQDRGWYQCRVLFLTQPYDDRNGSWIYLTVTTPPTFRRTPPPLVEARLGDPVLLICEARGVPEPVVTWTKDGRQLTPFVGGEKYQVTDGRLRLEMADRSNVGVYVCEANSEEGNLMHSTQVLVRGPPAIVRPPGNVTVNYTQEVFFPCGAEAHPANLSYSWLKEGVNVRHLSELRLRIKILVDGSLLLSQSRPRDSGLYTCVASNGIGDPPRASAHLSVLHPAYVSGMPEVTYLAVGMGGQIDCPSRAEPPLQYVNWTKDGAALDLGQFPGWYLNDDSSIVIPAVNDETLGVYSCTPYNSYGTLGQSHPTLIVLKEPPRFIVRPAVSYRWDVGRELIIGCSATGDPPPVVSWTKEGLIDRSRYRVSEDGALVFQSTSKAHHGRWTCVALNNITQISTTTKVFVLGTSPHTVTNVSVRSGVFGVNVSWEPGFDGGSQQQFTVWLRRVTRAPHDWSSRRVPLGRSHLDLADLRPEACYQFSVLAQNDRGSGPFSEIITAWTLSVPVTTAPATHRPPTRAQLLPPRALAANRTRRGIVLCWAAPPPPSRPALGYLLEYRAEGDWGLLHSAIPAGQNQVLLTGLVKDSLYQFRVMAVSGSVISEPSELLNVSTTDMAIYPSGTRESDSLAHPVQAGIIAGTCFLAITLAMSALAACVMRRRRRRRRRRTSAKDAPIIFSRYQKTPEPERSDSPDSVAKLKLETSGYQTLERTSLQPSRADESKRTQYESHLGATGPLESIRRGADGRFVVHLDKAPVRPLPEIPGVTRGRPRARYFPLASSSPSDEARPLCIPDLSPIPRPQAPGGSPGRLARPGFPDDRPGPDFRLPGGLGRGGAGYQAALALERPEASGLFHRGWFPRPPSLARSGGTGSPAPESSGFHSGEGSQRLADDRSQSREEWRRYITRRDASGDENYGWDADFAVESGILESLRLYKGMRPNRPNSTIVLQELERKASPAWLGFRRPSTVRSLEALHHRPASESRCVALRAEFQEYRRRREEEEERALGKGLICDEHLEQATLL